MNITQRLNKFEENITDEEIRNILAARCYYKDHLSDTPRDELLKNTTHFWQTVPPELLTAKLTGRLREAEIKSQMRHQECLKWSKEQAEQEVRRWIKGILPRAQIRAPETTVQDIIRGMKNKDLFRKVDFQKLEQEYL
jgi:hypothetical protein